MGTLYLNEDMAHQCTTYALLCFKIQITPCSKCTKTPKNNVWINVLLLYLRITKRYICLMNNQLKYFFQYDDLTLTKRFIGLVAYPVNDLCHFLFTWKWKQRWISFKTLAKNDYPFFSHCRKQHIPRVVENSHFFRPSPGRYTQSFTDYRLNLGFSVW